MTRSVLKNRRILVVEDDLFISLDLKMELHTAGAIVLGPAGRVQVALQIIASEPEIAAAVLDINLCGETVFPVADALLQRDIPFIFASGESRDDIPTRFAGIVLYPKPYSSSDLVLGISGLMMA